MRIWWKGLSGRERMLIGVMTGLIGILLIIFGLIRPITGFKAAASQNLVAARTTADFVDQAVLSSTVGTTLSGNRSGSEIRSIIAGIAVEKGLRLNNSRLGEDDLTVSVSISNLSTDDLFGWLVTLQEQETISVRDARITRARNGQGIQAQITFAEDG